MGAFNRRSRDEPAFGLRGVLEPPLGFDGLVSVGMSPTAPIALWATRDGANAFHSTFQNAGGPTFANTKPPFRTSAAIASYDSNGLEPAHVAVVDDLPITFPFVQRLANDEFLVVGARCSWSPDGPENNALVVDSTGSIVRTGTLGDGIEHVQVDGDGDIWVGYFDEGVYGNFGWGRPGPPPLGAPGIVKWSSQFERLWDYRWEDASVIDDCYTMNVIGNVVWACTYSDFPLLRIEDGQVQMRTTVGVSGPRGTMKAAPTAVQTTRPKSEFVQTRSGCTSRIVGRDVRGGTWIRA